LTHDPLVIIPIAEWFTNCGVTIVLRVLILCMLIMMAVGVLILGFVISMERSAVHHQCEKNYVLWPMAVANLILYTVIVLTYYFNKSDFWARVTGCIFSVVLCGMVAWWAVVLIRMAHICITFYTIKYPALQAASNWCGVFNGLFMVLFCLRECCLGLFMNCINRSSTSTESSEENTDPSLITNVFYKQNEAFVPSLFGEEKIADYQSGVTSWRECVTDRNESLKQTLDKAETIHSQSRNQSQLLNQLTDVVQEVGTKLNKTDKLMEEQDGLITDLHLTVNNLNDQLGGMSIKSGSMGGLMGGTWTDCCKWSGISLMCCAIVTMVFVAIPKWLHLFGISFGWYL